MWRSLTRLPQRQFCGRLGVSGAGTCRGFLVSLAIDRAPAL
jgi:hypothetical protein